MVTEPVQLAMSLNFSKRFLELNDLEGTWFANTSNSPFWTKGIDVISQNRTLGADLMKKILRKINALEINSELSIILHQDYH